MTRVRPKKRFVLLKTGDTLESIQAELGDFDRLFLAQLEGVDAELRVVQAHRDEPLPKAIDFDGLIITGSPHSVTARQPWADRAAALLREALAANKHIFGVCYGHQLLAHAIGGVVAKNPQGYEVGTIGVELTREGLADPLFGPIARASEGGLYFNSTHSDAVMSLPDTARVLASTALTAVQAFAVGERAWGVQFHPELNERAMKLYVEGRVPLITSNAQARGVDPAVALDRARASVRATPAGRMLLRRFVEAVG